MALLGSWTKPLARRREQPIPVVVQRMGCQLVSIRTVDIRSVMAAIQRAARLQKEIPVSVGVAVPTVSAAQRRAGGHTTTILLGGAPSGSFHG